MNNTELAKKVWDSLKGSTAKAKKFKDLVAVSFSLLSEENEDIFVAVREGQLMVEPYRYDDNNCEVEASADIIAKMFSGEISFDTALKDGSVQVKSGDCEKLKALECLVPSKKTAAKAAKPAAKAAKPAAKPAAKAEEKAAVKTEEKKAAPAAPAKPAEKAAVKPEEKKAAPAAPAAPAKPAAKKPAKKK